MADVQSSMLGELRMENSSVIGQSAIVFSSPPPGERIKVRGQRL
jgi:hypothetical protein